MESEKLEKIFLKMKNVLRLPFEAIMYITTDHQQFSFSFSHAFAFFHAKFYLPFLFFFPTSMLVSLVFSYYIFSAAFLLVVIPLSIRT